MYSSNSWQSAVYGLSELEIILYLCIWSSLMDFLSWCGSLLSFLRKWGWEYEHSEQLRYPKGIYICRLNSVPPLHFTAFCLFIEIILQNTWFGSVCSPVLPPIIRNGFCLLLLPLSFSILLNPWELRSVKPVVGHRDLLLCPLQFWDCVFSSVLFVVCFFSSSKPDHFHKP